MSNLTVRILTAVLAIPIIILLVIFGDIFFLLFVLIISFLAQNEFYKLAAVKGSKPIAGLGLFTGSLIILSFFHKKVQFFVVEFFEKNNVFIPFPSQTQLILIISVLAVITILLVEMFRNRDNAIQNISTTVLGIFYVPLFLGTLVGIRELFIPFDFPVYRFFPVEVNLSDSVKDQIYLWGGYTVLTIFATIWICDTAAYFGGKMFGKHKLFERVSPNKTWEGAISGFIFAIAFVVAAKYLVLDYLSVENAVVIGIIVGVFGQLGDLAESKLKRDAGVKDSSTLIPGHGGVLDRFDSVLFVAPLVFLFLDFVVFS
ncbi:MAG: phosphatidate cytidylyltransferase [Bacteroidota bacterium]|nr:phosphatidate cytidylyltransferase [Bacteroidota bacterium]